MGRLMFNVTGEMAVALLLAFFGFVGTTSGIILHLRIAGVIKDVRIEVQGVRLESSNSHADVKLMLEQLKTKIAEAEGEHYKELMKEIAGRYMETGLVEAKHKQNTLRLDALKEGQDQINNRLQLIEERLPV